MSKNIVITGANRGIGLALTRLYAAAGNSVVAVCRSSSVELQTIPNTTIVANVDVTDGNELEALAHSLNGRKVDILINNAGILSEENFDHIDYARVEHQFQVNAIGPLRTTETLRDHFRPGSKVVLITSRMGSLSDNSSGASYGYRMSKAALNASGVSLAFDLKPLGVSVSMLHPGFVKTELVGNRGDISAKEAAVRLAARIEEMKPENSGTFRHSNGGYLSW